MIQVKNGQSIDLDDRKIDLWKSEKQILNYNFIQILNLGSKRLEAAQFWIKEKFWFWFSFSFRVWFRFYIWASASIIILS